MNCDWNHCPNEATEELFSSDGTKWSDLCLEHKIEFDRDAEAGNMKRICANWVKANGGSKKLAKKMAEEVTDQVNEEIE